jgi:hypothetical protein
MTKPADILEISRLGRCCGRTRKPVEVRKAAEALLAAGPAPATLDRRCAASSERRPASARSESVAAVRSLFGGSCTFGQTRGLARNVEGAGKGGRHCPTKRASCPCERVPHSPAAFFAAYCRWRRNFSKIAFHSLRLMQVKAATGLLCETYRVSAAVSDSGCVHWGL